MRKYDSYKDSGIEWIGEIPSHWEKSRLAFNGEFYKGKGVSKADLSIDGVPVMLYGDIYTKYNLKTEKLVRHIPIEVAQNSFSIEKGDLLFAASGETPDEIGKCICYMGEDEAYASGDVIVFRQMSNDSVFLSYLFNSYKVNEQKAKLSKGEIVVHIYSSQLRDIRFPLPPYTEQTAIAHYLDRKTAEIDELIADKKRLLELYEEEKTAIINQAVTKGINPDVPMKDSGIEWLGKIPEHWYATSLKRLVETKITDGPHETPTFLLEGVPFVSAEAVKNGKIDFNYARGFISEEDDEKYSKKCKPKRNDIFIVKSGSTTGKIALVDFDDNFNIWSPLALVRVNKKVDFMFMYYALQSTYFQDSIKLFWSYGTQPNIGMNVIENLKVAFAPDLNEQLQIIRHIEQTTLHIDNQISRIQKLIELLTEYRTALISEVVTGKVKVID